MAAGCAAAPAGWEAGPIDRAPSRPSQPTREPPSQHGAALVEETWMRGPVLLLAGIVLFALLDANGKLLSGEYPLGQACDYPQLGRSAISIPSSMSARRESPRQRTMMPGGGSRERPRWPPRRASFRT
jgi:hypothetical protein